MNRNDLYKKRILPALDEMYVNSWSAFQDGNAYTFTDFTDYAPVICGKRMLPYSAFFIDKTVYDKIREKYTKGLRHVWRWRYRTEYVYDDESIERMKEELKSMDPSSFEYKHQKDKIDRNPEYKERERLWKAYRAEIEPYYDGWRDKKISLKEVNQKEAELAAKYDMERRCPDGETVDFNLMNYSPSCSSEYPKKLSDIYSVVSTAIKSGKTLEDALSIIEKESVRLDIETMCRFKHNYENKINTKK